MNRLSRCLLLIGGLALVRGGTAPAADVVDPITTTSRSLELAQANDVLVRLERFWAGSLGYAWRVPGSMASDAA